MSSRSTTRASSPNATAPFEPLARQSSVVRRACPWMFSAPVTSRLVTFLASWCSDPGSILGLTNVFHRFAQCVFWPSPDPMCEKCGHRASCRVRGAGLVSYGTAVDYALVEAHHVNGWRQQRTSTFSSKRQLAWHRLGVCLHKA